MTDEREAERRRARESDRYLPPEPMAAFGRVPRTDVHIYDAEGTGLAYIRFEWVQRRPLGMMQEANRQRGAWFDGLGYWVTSTTNADQIQAVLTDRGHAVDRRTVHPAALPPVPSRHL